MRRNHGSEVLLAGVEAEGPERDLELLLLNSAAATGVKQVKCVLDLLLLLLAQLVLVGVLGFGLRVFSFVLEFV